MLLLALAATAQEQYAPHSHYTSRKNAELQKRNLQGSPDELLRQSGDAAQRQDWRTCADAYQAAYHTSSSEWELRYNCLSGYCSVLREGSVEVTREDSDMLLHIADDVATPRLHRVQALFTLGFVAHLKNDADDSRLFYGDALRVGRELSDAERAELVTVATAKAYEPTPVGSILDGLLQYSEDNLRLLGPGRGEDAYNGQAMGDAAYDAPHGHYPEAAQRHAHEPEGTRTGRHDHSPQQSQKHAHSPQGRKHDHSPQQSQKHAHSPQGRKHAHDPAGGGESEQPKKRATREQQEARRRKRAEQQEKEEL